MRELSRYASRLASTSLSLHSKLLETCFAELESNLMQQTTDQIRNFLQFIALQFIKYPDEDQLKVAEVSDNHIRFRLVLNQNDVAILIGRNGFTASAIRNILKAAAVRDGIQATLQIVSHEEERQRMAAIEAGEIIEELPTDDDIAEQDDENLEEA